MNDCGCGYLRELCLRSYGPAWVERIEAEAQKDEQPDAQQPDTQVKNAGSGMGFIRSAQ
jgi:hypothetical protein